MKTILLPYNINNAFKLFFAIQFPLLLVILGCSENPAIELSNSSTVNPVYLFPQEKIFKAHFILKWTKSDNTNDYKILLRETTDTTKQYIFTRSDTVSIISSLNTDIDYYVNVFVKDTVMSNTQIYSTKSNARNVYVPEDTRFIETAIKEYGLPRDTLFLKEDIYDIKAAEIPDSLYILGLGKAEKIILTNDGQTEVFTVGDDKTIFIENLTIETVGTVFFKGDNYAKNVIFKDISDFVSYSFTTNKYTFKNCIFYGIKDFVFGFYEDSFAEIENCIFVNNNDVIKIGNLSGSDNNGNIMIRNSIFYGNYGNNILSVLPTQGDDPIEIVTIKYSNIETNLSGIGLINENPLFVDLLNFDFHLKSKSGCIDSGDPDSIYNDVDGSRNDMGAYGGKYGEW